MSRAAWRTAAAIVLALALPAAARAAPTPIPEEPDGDPPPVFAGAAGTQDPLFVARPPRHPFMAPNNRSNIHNDAYQSDAHDVPGPLGRDMERVSNLRSGVCGSITIDSRGRLVTVCVGITGPTLYMIDPKTLDTLATFNLPPRQPGNDPGANAFQDFAGGGYFYLDQRDRAIIPTTTRHLYVVAEAPGGDPGFQLERDYDLTSAVPLGDKIISALPDWSGRIWFASVDGVVGTVDPASGTTRSRDLGEDIANSFAVDELGAVYLVTVEALYRMEAGADGTPQTVWREEYANTGQQKPGQASAGSGTTPTVMDGGLIAITDNADPMNVVVYRRDAQVSGPRAVCTQPVFKQGESATDNSLIAAGRSLVVENNFGYTGPTTTMEGRTTAPGVDRVDLDADGSGCRRVWHSDERSPTLVPKLSLPNGLVYVYTKDPGDEDDPWYLTALDFRTGRTVYKRLAGEGFGFNNNYAAVMLGPDGSAYVGVIGGVVMLRDRRPPPGAVGGPPSPGPRVRLKVRYRPRRLRGGRTCVPRVLRASVVGRDAGAVRRADFRFGRRKAGRDRRAPIRKHLRVPGKRTPRRVKLSARLRLANGQVTTLRRRLLACPRR